ncbi:MAG: ATP-binding cassette domain-containing protein, partial [Planctomycetaceae bacterium]|nr:ATP-binding cassette domain-containing protein [Planctomycetaceae bacterium]
MSDARSSRTGRACPCLPRSRTPGSACWTGVSTTSTGRASSNSSTNSSSPCAGSDMLELDRVSVRVRGVPLLRDVSLKLAPGDFVALLGPNGAGKTTLLKMITGQEKPDSGTVKIGDTVKLSYVDQNRTLDPEKTVYEEISQGADFLELGKRKINSRAYCASFNFQGSDQQKKVGILSGGERNRVHLAKTLTEGANVILLDEPTNDLDVNTLRALEEA